MKHNILQYLSTECPWRDTLYWYNETGSTNTDLKALADNGAAHGTVVLAGSQHAGRGRMGRSFLSPSGSGIYMSLLLRPDCHAEQLMHLTCAAAVGVCDAITQSCGFRPQIKWINDLVWQRKKLGGILTELSLNADGTVNYAIIGIGLNVSSVPADVSFMASSLSQAIEEDIDPAKVSAALIDVFSRMDYMNTAAIMTRYRQDCMTIGQQVRVCKGDEEFIGIAQDLCHDGSLIVRKGDGTTVTVSSGEVSVRGMYGYL